MTGLARLAVLLREEGGLLAEALAETPSEDALLERAAAGPRAGAPGEQARDPAAGGGRAGAAAAEYALVLAAVREGYLLHYADGRVVRTDDADLALLGGDRLYALALARLAQLGDLDAVTRLADLISRCAQAHGDGDPSLAEAAWSTAAEAIGRGARRGV